MSQKTIILISTLFIVLIAGMFIFAYMKRAEIQQPVPEEQVPIEVPTDPYADIARIDAKHYFIDGTHTLVGEVVVPTPCDLVEAQATVAESAPEQVTIDFTVVNTAESCAQVQTPYRFRTDFVASAEAVIAGRFMGRSIELNVIPAAPGEVPEEFELFSKG